MSVSLNKSDIPLMLDELLNDSGSESELDDSDMDPERTSTTWPFHCLFYKKLTF